MLRLMATPEDVFDAATVYLQIYIGGRNDASKYI